MFQFQFIINYAVVLVAIFILGCNNKQSKKDAVIADLQESLERSTMYMGRNNAGVYSYIEDATSDPYTNVKAKAWLPKARDVKSETDSVIKFIDKILVEFKGYLKGDSVNKEKVYKYFIKDSKGKLLYQTMEDYRKRILNIDPIIAHSIGSINIHENDEVAFLNQFSSTSPMEAEVLLTNFKFKARVIENRVIHLFSDQWTRHIHGDLTYYTALVAQNSKHVKAGDDLEITAAVGAFSTRPGTVIKINGKEIEISEDGAAHYKIKAPRKKGKYYVPTVLEFFSADGEKVKITKDVEYIVD